MIKRMTEKEKMLAGEVYSAVDPELIEELMATREVLYNLTWVSYGNGI